MDKRMVSMSQKTLKLSIKTILREVHYRFYEGKCKLSKVTCYGKDRQNISMIRKL